MTNVRSSYPSEVSDEEGALCAPYLTLMKEDAPPRRQALRELCNGWRWFVRAGCFAELAAELRGLLRLGAGRHAAPSAVILDSRTRQATPESGGRAGYDGAKKRKGSKVHAAVDTLGHLLARKVTAAHEQDRAQVQDLAQTVQAATGGNVKLASADQGHTGEQPAADAARHGLRSEVVRHPEAKRGFGLLPRRWVVERAFAGAARFHRLARDHERLAPTLAAYHWLALVPR